MSLNLQDPENLSLELNSKTGYQCKFIETGLIRTLLFISKTC